MWFGSGIPEMKSGASKELAPTAADDASPVETSVESEPPAEWDAPDEKDAPVIEELPSARHFFRHEFAVEQNELMRHALPFAHQEFALPQ